MIPHGLPRGSTLECEFPAVLEGLVQLIGSRPSCVYLLDVVVPTTRKPCTLSCVGSLGNSQKGGGAKAGGAGREVRHPMYVGAAPKG